jgi:hypothetical protein
MIGQIHQNLGTTSALALRLRKTMDLACRKIFRILTDFHPANSYNNMLNVAAVPMCVTVFLYQNTAHTLWCVFVWTIANGVSSFGP